MIRFFTDSGSIDGDVIRLSAEDAQHIHSLRLRPDETFIVCDGNSTDYVCRLSEDKAGDNTRNIQPAAQILSSKPSLSEPTVKCTLYMAYMKGERLDYAVQKSVELGVRKIILFPSERSVAKPGNSIKKTERLSRIALETAKQCGRGIIPEVSTLDEFEDAVYAASTLSDTALICYEDEKHLHLKTVLSEKISYKTDTIAVITGPEGGFELSEVQLAKSNGIPAVSLGPRILRSETAPVAVLSAIMYHTGNL